MLPRIRKAVESDGQSAAVLVRRRRARSRGSELPPWLLLFKARRAPQRVQDTVTDGSTPYGACPDYIWRLVRISRSITDLLIHPADKNNRSESSNDGSGFK